MFRCVIDNGCGSPVVSNAATLTVCTPPQITMQPQDQNVVSGSAVTYSITAQGTMLTYQWQKSTDNLVWSDISDATSSTYLINAQASDNGIRFRCIVRSKCGDITSASAVLFVNEKPKAQFSASPVSGPAPLMVQFTDSSLGTITKWQWNFGDGYYDTLKTTRHEYTLPGSYTVTLNVDGPAGSDSIKKIAYISVFDTTKPLPVQNIAFSNIGASSVKLTWLASKSVDADSIKIYGSLHSWINNSDSFEYKACLPANVTEYLFTGLPKYGCLLYVSIFVKDLYGNLSEPAKDSVFLLDSVPPQNNLTINLSNIKDTAIFISWKIDTNIKDAKSILMACAYNKKPMYSDMDVFPYKDSTIIITNIKEPGIWYIATSVSDSVKNNSPIRYDSIEIANVPPIFAENKDKNLKEDELFIDTLKAFDINNDKIIYNLLTSLEGLKIDSTKGIILWMPDNNQVGTHSIIVCAKDSRNAITFDTIVYTVVNVNDKPSIIYIGDTNVYEDSVFKGKIIINDPDPQDSCRIVYKKLPDWCMLINDTIKGIPYSGSAGIDSILIVIEDKEGLQDTLNKKINILFTNHSPIIDSCNITKQIDERNLFIATYYGKDIDKNDSISVRWIKKPTWLEIKKINKNNFDFEIYLTGIPFGRDTGLNKYSFDICDKHNSCVNIIDSVFVLDINDAPMAFIDKNKKQVKYGAVKYVVYGKDDFDSVLTFKSKISKLGDTIAIMEKTTNYGEIEFYPLVDGEYEFSVVAIDKNGAFDTSFVKDTFIIKGSTKFSLAGDTLWKMFSVPSKPKSFDGILTNGFIYHWDESFTEKNIYGYYRNAKELIQTTAGYSYWLKSTDTVTINLTEKDLLNDSVNIILSKDKFGWNQIASPYSYPILWNFTSVVWKWNIKTQDFEDAGNILEPWQGYWVAVDTTTNVTFKNIPVFSQPILSKRKAVYFTGPNEWQVRLVFSYNDGQDAANIFGFSSSAKDEYDNSDAPEPPRMNISPYICFYHPEWNKNFTEFAYDIRKNISQVNVFPIAINTFGKKIINAKILLEGQENIKDMYFYIGDENKIEKIEPQKPIIINTESSNKILYKTLFVSNYKNLASYLPPKFYLNMPYPNPMQRSTSIKFALPYSLENIIKNKKNYLVDISIYDVRGRKIRQLVYSRKEPGYYSIIWDGKNNSRILVSNGIYYLKFSAEQFNAVQKIIVSK
jgi:PKD repeat protein